MKRDTEIPDLKRERDLIVQEFHEDPFRKFNVVFSLMSIIPFLVFLYLIIARLFTPEVLSGDIGVILCISLFISICGLYAGYGVIRNILGKIAYYATTAKQCDKLKSMFIASASHELSNPIFALSLHVEGLLDGMFGELAGKQKITLELCQSITDRMRELVDNLLNLYKIEAGMIELKLEPYNIAELPEKHINRLLALMGRKQVRLEKEITNKDLAIMADKTKIPMVLNNLIMNAIESSPDNSTIKLKIFPSGKFVRIEIHDQGDEIARHKIKKIFDKFERLDETKKGIELGLAIAKDIVQLHNGHIWAESSPGKGNTFIVVLPRV
ncbi:MAG: HAMP domain-containing sensor histidine kinase [Candidatus Omnitrophota bacterium]